MIFQFLADVAELVDALDLGSSVFDVRVRVSPSASEEGRRQKAEGKEVYPKNSL